MAYFFSYHGSSHIKGAKTVHKFVVLLEDTTGATPVSNKPKV